MTGSSGFIFGHARQLQGLLATVLFAGLLLVGCEKVELISEVGEPSLDDGSERDRNPGWLIPENEVLDGGPGKDGIPALSNPPLVASGDAPFLSNQDLVIGIVIDGVARAYPHSILDWHEIINDAIAGRTVAITYCPLTGSGIGWDRWLSTEATTFGVSGMLYNSNLIPYDRETESYWSQMKLKCVFGENKGQTPLLVPVLETTWGTWRGMYPSTRVVSTNTGFSRPYGLYPYGSYRTAQSLLFPVNPLDSRLPLKERLGGVIVDGQARTYPFSLFEQGVGVINDTYQDQPVVVVGSEPSNFIMIFQRTMPDDVQLTFTPLQNQLPAIMTDNEGTTWDVFGQGLDGPRAGQKLPFARSFIAYWFAWGAFYPGAEIYTG